MSHRHSKMNQTRSDRHAVLLQDFPAIVDPLATTSTGLPRETALLTSPTSRPRLMDVLFAGLHLLGHDLDVTLIYLYRQPVWSESDAKTEKKAEQ
ncbi:unnamed protein product [Boreogadus saida]